MGPFSNTPLQDSHLGHISDTSYSDGIVDDGTEKSASTSILNGINNDSQSGFSTSTASDLGPKSNNGIERGREPTNIIQPPNKPLDQKELSEKNANLEAQSQEKTPLVSGRQTGVGRSRNGYGAAHSHCSHSYVINISSGSAGRHSKSRFNVVYKRSLS